MTIDDIWYSVRHHNEALQGLTSRRGTWHGQKRKYLLEKLNEIIKPTQTLDLTYDFHQPNRDSITVFFKPVDSGLTINDGSRLNKNGGQLIFELNSHGFVDIITKFPFIAGFLYNGKEEIKTERQNNFHPDFINEQFILNQLYDFIQKMIRWEKGDFYME